MFTICIVKFGSEMAAKGSQKIGRENPSLSGGFAALCAPHPFLLARGALANNLKLKVLTAFGLSPRKSLQEQAPDGLARKKPSALR
jgi:hypothetical protein